MNTERLRYLFWRYLKENDLENAIICDISLTQKEDPLLKYERIDKYRVLLLPGNMLKSMLTFCMKNGIDVWFGADKLCIGYNFKANMRLSAYGSNYVPLRSGPGERDRDRIEAVIA